MGGALLPSGGGGGTETVDTRALVRVVEDTGKAGYDAPNARGENAVDLQNVRTGGGTRVASGELSILCGGENNTASAWHSICVGGLSNTVSAAFGTICGGTANAISNDYGTVGGGSGNVCSGLYSTIPGGQNNAATGLRSFAGGYRAKASHTGSLVFADNTNADYLSRNTDTFNISYAGGFFAKLKPGANPSAPATNDFVIWMADGVTGHGANGDIMIASTVGGVTNYGTLFDHSAGALF